VCERERERERDRVRERERETELERERERERKREKAMWFVLSRVISRQDSSQQIQLVTFKSYY
jgi:hypothetical protein